ncbi:MAG TPA: hypothetical protein VMZ32_12450, partial [Gammaproteobacteria bacterium]|nr:hypothetical protein [Gammaproteobacteria bacterium]
MLPAAKRLIDITLLLLTCALLSPLTVAYADDSKTAEQSLNIDSILTEIDRESRSISNLGKRLTDAEDIIKIALESRLIRSRMNLLEQNLAFL